MPDPVSKTFPLAQSTSLACSGLLYSVMSISLLLHFWALPFCWHTEAYHTCPKLKRQPLRWRSRRRWHAAASCTCLALYRRPFCRRSHLAGTRGRIHLSGATPQTSPLAHTSLQARGCLLYVPDAVSRAFPLAQCWHTEAYYAARRCDADLPDSVVVVDGTRRSLRSPDAVSRAFPLAQSSLPSCGVLCTYPTFYRKPYRWRCRRCWLAEAYYTSRRSVANPLRRRSRHCWHAEVKISRNL